MVQCSRFVLGENKSPTASPTKGSSPWVKFMEIQPFDEYYTDTCLYGRIIFSISHWYCFKLEELLSLWFCRL